MAETVKKSATPAKPRKSAPKKKAAVTTETDHHNHRAISHDDVAQLAHRYWIERGRPHGTHEEDWFRAEQELRSEAS